MVAWMEKNKWFMIGFFTTLTTTIVLFFIQRIVLHRNQLSIQSSIDNGNVNNELMFVFTMDILVNILVGVSAIYFLLITFKMSFDYLKKLKGV